MSATGGGVDTPRYVVAMVTHGAPSDTFWDLVRKGAEDAAKKNNIELRYSSDPQAPNQASLVQSAINSQVDGLAVTLPNAEAIGPVAKKQWKPIFPPWDLMLVWITTRNTSSLGFLAKKKKLLAPKPENGYKKQTLDTHCA